MIQVTLHLKDSQKKCGKWWYHFYGHQHISDYKNVGIFLFSLDDIFRAYKIEETETITIH